MNDLVSEYQQYQDATIDEHRQLHLEIEPGTFLVANAGVVLCQV